MLVENRRDVVQLFMMYDSWSVSNGQVEAFLSGVEEIAVEAAFDPAAVSHAVRHVTPGASTTAGDVPADQQSAAEAAPRDAAQAAKRSAADAATIIMRLFRALERLDTGLTPQQCRILRMAGAGGERSARLAERLAVARPTLTATADGLVTAGYLQRGAEPRDRRVVRLCLTPAGRAALGAAEAAYAGRTSGLLSDSGDPAAVMDALLALEAVMDQRWRGKQLAATAAPANGGTA